MGRTRQIECVPAPDDAGTQYFALLHTEIERLHRDEGSGGKTQMRGLTLHQPWASLVAEGRKEYETRSWVEEYAQWEANQFYIPGFGLTPEPTPTPSPLRDSEVASKVFLAKVWENGCQAGRRDAAGAEQATLMGLRDQLNLLDARIAALEPTPTPTPTP